MLGEWGVFADRRAGPRSEAARARRDIHELRAGVRKRRGSQH